MAEDTKQGPPQFIPKLRDKKVIIRLISGGRPVTGTIEGYNPYETPSRQQKANSWYSSTLFPLLRWWMNRRVTSPD